MFLTKDDASATDVVSTSSCERTRVTRPAIQITTRSTTPERWTAADTTRALPTMITISSENPANASSGLTMPSASETSNARMAMTS